MSRIFAGYLRLVFLRDDTALRLPTEFGDLPSGDSGLFTSAIHLKGIWALPKSLTNQDVVLAFTHAELQSIGSLAPRFLLAATRLRGIPGEGE